MRNLLVLALVLGLVGVAAAYDLDNQAPVKSPISYPENIPNPALQGGDTFANATVINSLPYNDSGTTVGYANDYEATCPFTGASPDVVYKYVAGVTETWSIDLCGSSYDTKLYVMDPAQVILACNDDFYSGPPCGVYVSLIENFTFTAGSTYYIVVDGYGSNSAGAYLISIEGPPPPCDLVCPAGGFPEGEPNPAPEYVDNYNGGCNTPPYYPFQHIELGWDGATLCGVSGWYTVGGGNSRDTDWFIVRPPQAGVAFTADAEYATYIFELGSHDCSTGDVIQNVIVGPCAEGFMGIPCAPLFPVWLWVGPTVFVAPTGAPNYYDYTIWFFGYGDASEPTTWSTVKALFQ